MSYKISILRRAQKELASLPRKDFEQVRETIRNLAEGPNPRLQKAHRQGRMALAGRKLSRYL
jgi:mRNA-degrading endonuclease RelE of RelBE toxin-antitoxin system